LALLVSFGLSVRAQAVVVISPHSLASDRGISCVCLCGAFVRATIKIDQ